MLTYGLRLRLRPIGYSLQAKRFAMILATCSAGLASVVARFIVVSVVARIIAQRFAKKTRGCAYLTQPPANIIVRYRLFGVLDVDNLDLEYQHLVGADAGLGHALRAIGQFAGDVEHGAAALAQHLQTFAETGNHTCR